MNAVLPGWSADLERSFKELLYRFLEEIQSTKAALYLLAPDGQYLLMTQYGFGRRDLLAAELHAREPLVGKIGGKGTKPLCFNDIEEILDLLDYLEGAATSRLLLVPLVMSNKLVGFVDARDKGRKRAFGPDDLSRAANISDALLHLIDQADLYPELRPERPLPEPEPEPEEAPRIALPPSPMMELPERMERPQVKTGAAWLDPDGLARIRDAASDMLHREGVVAIALTVIEGAQATTLIYTQEGGESIEREAVLRHQTETLRQAGIAAPAAECWEVATQELTCAAEAPGSRLVVSAPLALSQGWALLASAVGILGSAAAQAVVERLQQIAELARDTARMRHARRMLSRRLLRPGEREFIDLETHSFEVSRLCALLCRTLGVAPGAVEEASLAGLLHDVGMRELEYSRIYRHASPGPAERRLYEQHVIVGERLVQACGFQHLPTAVRHHHERWDGNGYPDGLSGEGIPLLARLVHVAEVFDVLTSSSSYRSPVSSERALSIMRGAAGHQFDPEMVEALARVIA